ncbi:MAG: DUF72 domain-containing protein [Candidatus Aminicenantes bacterium]|nr:DUF72 domain-containing protein [Candidatus Aminicenantes bacterium]
MARYFVGTAGWSYEDWEGVVYPPSKGRGFHPLAFLAAYIDIVEVNSTFYRPPSAALSLAWVKKLAPFPDFLLAVKLHRVFSHERGESGPRDVDDFKRGIAPLVAARRLAALLLQFPWSFRRTQANEDYLAAVLAAFSDYPLAVEVRHASWQEPAFYDLLRDRGAAVCNIDQPLFADSIPPGAVATTPAFAYVRLHGRNVKDWFRKDAGRDDRYNYLYGRDELADWIERIKALGRASGRVFVITNNHYRGQAMANALQIKNMISGDTLDIPALLLETYPVLKEIVKKIRDGQFDLFDEKSRP